MPGYIPAGFEDFSEDDKDSLYGFEVSGDFDKDDIKPASEDITDLPKTCEGERAYQTWIDDEVLDEDLGQGSGLGDLELQRVLQSGSPDQLSEVLDKYGLDINTRSDLFDGLNASSYCSSRGNTSLLLWMLQNGGVMEGSQEPDLILLTSANVRCETSAVKCAEIIIGSGVDIDAYQCQKKTALMFAAGNGYSDLVKVLCDRGADKDAVDTQGWSAIMFAVDRGHGVTTRKLLDAGANPALVNINGQTAADIAASAGRQELQDVLEGFCGLRAVVRAKTATDGNGSVNGSSLTEVGNDDQPDDRYRGRLRKQMDELRFVLVGLKLQEFYPALARHKVDLEEFLVLTDSDLIEMGVTCVGARKRIQEGQSIIHKRKWERGSMPQLTLKDKKAGLRLSIVDAATILANVEQHSRYLKASVAYLRLQLIDHGPRLLEVGRDLVKPEIVVQHVEACSTQLAKLDAELKSLATELKAARSKVADEVGNYSPGYPKTRIGLAVVLTASLAMAVVYHSKRLSKWSA